MHGTAIDDVLVFLLAAVFVVSLFKYLKASAVLGYLFAGAFIGPMALGLIDNVKDVEKLGEIGVVFMLFSIGLKMSIRRLNMLRQYVFGLGFAQFIVTSAVIMGICYAFGLTPMLSFVIGSGFALSSTAVSMQVIKERGESSSRFGRVTFAILLAQDFAVILLLILDSTLSSGGGDGVLQAIGDSAIKAVGVLLMIAAFGRWILRPVYKIIAGFKSQELFSATSLFVVLGTSTLTHNAGLSMELGAFLAGLLIAETEYRHQVEADISPFAGLLLGLFFITVGMKIDIKLFVEFLPVITGIIIAMIVIKVTITFLLAILFKLPKATALRASLVLATGSEFLFILFAKSVESGIMEVEIGNIFVVSVALSMALTPFLDSLGKYIEDRVISTESDVSLKSAVEEIADLKNHVIIAGFGRVGRLVAEVLSRQMIPYVAIDNDMNNVSEGRSEGHQVFYGDARRAMVLQTLGIEKARTLLICLDNESSTMMTALMVRHNFPHISVAARMEKDDLAERVKKAGAHVIVPEIIEPSLQLAAYTLENFGVSKDQVVSIVNECRNNLSRNIRENDNNGSDATDDISATLGEIVKNTDGDDEGASLSDKSIVSTSSTNTSS